MKLYKGLAFFGVATLTVKGLLPFAKKNDLMLNTAGPYSEDPPTFLEKVNRHKVTPDSIMDELEAISNSTTLPSLAETIEHAKRLSQDDLDDFLEMLTPPLEQYLDGRGFDLNNALDEAYIYLKSSNLTTFRELLQTVDRDTRLMLILVLDEVAAIERDRSSPSPLFFLMAIIVLACAAAAFCEGDSSRRHRTP
ncbi:MAG: hypothetical protein H2069_01190 [Legionella sp.]|nr:hypothetical protein [Legionella sp.]